MSSASTRARSRSSQRSVRRGSAGRPRLAGLLFVAPVMLLVLTLVVGPLLYALWMSIFRERLIGGTVFAGLSHYTEALADERFLQGLTRMLVLLVVQVPVMLVLALAFALVLDSGRAWMPRVLRLGIFVPYAVPSVVAALMWGFIYGRDFGPLAQIARELGLRPLDFVGERLMLASLGNIVTWAFTGYNMMILYAALRAIPRELYRAAAVDGAGPLRTALHVKLPLLRPALLLCGIFSVIGTLQLFNEPAVMHQISPNVIGKSYTPNWYIYNLAFSDQRVNYAAALSFVLGAVVFALSFAVMHAVRRREA